MVIIFYIGRVLFGGFFVYNAINHLKNRTAMAVFARSKHIPVPMASVIVTGMLMLLGGLSIMIGYRMVIGMWLLLAFLIPTTLLMHQFWKQEVPEARMNEWLNFSKNIALIGALCIMLSLAYLYFS